MQGLHSSTDQILADADLLGLAALVMEERGFVYDLIMGKKVSVACQKLTCALPLGESTPLCRFYHHHQASLDSD